MSRFQVSAGMMNHSAPSAPANPTYKQFALRPMTVGAGDPYWSAGEFIFRDEADAIITGGTITQLNTVGAASLFNGLQDRAYIPINGTNYCGLKWATAKTVKTIEVWTANSYNTQYPATFDLIGRDEDADPWTVISTHEYLSLPAVNQVDTWNANGVVDPYSYVRIRTTDTHIGGDYFGCLELEIRESVGGADMSAEAVQATSYKDAGSAYNAWKAIDNNAGTLYTTGANALGPDGHWLLFRFPRLVDVREISFRVRSDSYREDPVTLYVDYAENTDPLANLWGVTGLAAWTAGETRVFTRP